MLFHLTIKPGGYQILKYVIKITLRGQTSLFKESAKSAKYSPL